MSLKINYSTAICIANPNVQGVRVNYDGATNKAYTFKTFDNTLEKGDLVLVPTETRHGYTVCKIEEINVDLDQESDIQYKWVVGKVDLTNYEDIIKQEELVISAFKEAVIAKKRSELAEAFGLVNSQKLQALPLVTAGNSTPTISETPSPAQPAAPAAA